MRLLITMLLAALIGAVALAACGDEEEPAPSPAPASLAEATPAPLWPRTDCPEGWLAYLDPDGYFSICYPSNLSKSPGQTSASPGNVGLPFNVTDPKNDGRLYPNIDVNELTNTFSLNAAWVKSRGYGSCENFSGGLFHASNQKDVEMDIEGRLGTGCN